MSCSRIDDAELLLRSKDDDWSNSVESIITQKIAKLTKSESLFKFPTKFSPSLTVSELELREAQLNYFKSKKPKWELVQEKSRFPRMSHTRSLLRDELEILKINMSAQDKAIALKDSRFLKDYQTDPKKKRKKSKRFVKYMGRPSFLLQKFVSNKVKDFLIEIEESESAKTDTVIWKFLKRGPSFRREFINARKLFIELQALHFPGLRNLSNSRFQNTQPVKVTCPNCRFFITTNVKKVSTIRTKLTSLALAFIGLCMVPHVIYAFKDTVHMCPLCKIYLGFCPAFGIRSSRRAFKLLQKTQKNYEKGKDCIDNGKMVSASSTSAKNLFVESKLRLSDRVQVNVNNIAAITRQIQRGSKANENLLNAAKNFALQEAAIENSETNLKKLKLLSTHMNNQLESLRSNSAKMDFVLEQVRSMQR